MANLSLRPIHYASVSGGKDSLYMLNLILNNPNKYPLDMVVHFELEIDWEWSKKVVDYIDSECNKHGIKFVRIKPRKSYQELYEKFGLPSRPMRWCNSHYKLDCERQLNKWIKEQNCRPVAYIGFCADEEKRFKYEIGDWKNQNVCYPLAEEGITEDVILRWARTVDMFNGWYALFKRQGCMFCPNTSRLELAYMRKYYRNHYDQWFEKIKLFEEKMGRPYWNKPIEEVDKLIATKWTRILEDREHYKQLDFFDI